jgi:hypothetical protein
LRLKREILFTSEYQASGDFIELRDDDAFGISHFPPYYQVFKDKTGFLPNMSILDLIFNEGLRAKEYLLKLDDTFLPLRH